MKRILRLFLFYLVSNIVIYSSQGQEWVTSYVINGTTIEPQSSVTDKDNNVYILTSFNDTIYNPFIKSYGLKDLFLIKIDPSGNILWHNRIGNISLDVPGGIDLDNQNNCYFSGTYYETIKFTPEDSLIHKGNGDVFIAKYNSNGTFQWAKRVASCSTIQSTADLKYDRFSNNIVLAGFFRDTLVFENNNVKVDTLFGNSNVSTFIAKFDNNCNYIWGKRFLSTNTLTRIKKIGISKNGYYFGGHFQGDMILDIGTISGLAPNNYESFVFKTDLNGNGLWVRRIRGPLTENFRTLTTDEYDNVYLLGNYNSPSVTIDSTASITNTYSGNIGGYDTYMAKYNRSGVLQWFLRKGSTARDIYNDFVVRNNVIYATGYFANQIVFQHDTLRTDNPLNEDAFLAAFNQIGDPIAGVSIVGTGNYNDAGTIVNMDANSRAYVSGYYKSQQIQIGDQTYTSNNVNKSDLFFAIYEHPLKAVITAEKMISCYGLTDGMLKVTPYFGKPPYTYKWSHDPLLNQPAVTDLPPGVYKVIVTDANNKKDSTFATITQPLPVTITENVTDVSCFNGETGSISLLVTGGTVSGDYNYYWTSSDGSGIEPRAKNQSGLSAGLYNIEVRDDNLCSASKAITVNQPDKVTFSGSVVTPITVPVPGNGAVTLSALGGNQPFSYQWAGPDNYSATTKDISGLGKAGLYKVTLTDSKNCLADTTFTVADANTLVAQVTARTDVTCHGLDNGTATVLVTNGQAPFTFSWSDGVVTATAYRSGMAPGKYQVLVTDGLSQTATDSVEIRSPLSPLMLSLHPQDLQCYQDSSGVIDLTVAGGTLPYQVAWNNGYAGEDLVNIDKGTYDVVVTDAHGCIAYGSSSVDEPGPIVLDIDLEGENLCPGDKGVMAIAEASGGFGSFEYLWDDPGAQITETAYDLEAGTYTVTVTDQHGCRKSGSVMITEPAAFITTRVDYEEPSCPGDADGSIVPWITGGTGGYDYVWSNQVYKWANDNIPAGTYTLTIRDDNNCEFIQQYTLNDPDTVKILSVETTDLTCSGMPDGSITIIATGGTGAYRFSVDGGTVFGSQPTITSLAEGNYTVVVKDANNCESADYPVTLLKSETCKMIIYDAFSPNNDGRNDYWNIGNIDNYPLCSVKIYNLWGILVFSSNGYGNAWDGTYNGKDLPAGTYYYLIDPGDGSDMISGSVSIVK